MKTFNDLISDALETINEIFPWDLEDKIKSDSRLLILDIREADEYEAMHIRGSLFIPRGLLEQACEWDYDVTIPELVMARDREIVIVCRSGTRSVLAALTMHLMGYQDVTSLKTGVRGWNDYDQPMVDNSGIEVDADEADFFLSNKVNNEQKRPK